MSTLPRAPHYPTPHDGYAPREAMLLLVYHESPVQRELLRSTGHLPKRVPTVAKLRAWLGAAPGLPLTGNGQRLYDDTCRFMAHGVLALLDRRPEFLDLPLVSAAMGDWHTPLAHPPNLWVAYAVMQAQADPQEEPLRALARVGVTQHQWGWSVNAARRLMELPPLAVPTLNEIIPIDLTTMVGYPDAKEAADYGAFYRQFVGGRP